ncbi:MAG: DUF4382 domain-containing protein [Steroidobacteraceae bacterium]|jgi:hypothetical protein|nr:DUF4382 domain-containing protein [Steroidobacteraceae bacterium]
MTTSRTGFPGALAALLLAVAGCGGGGGTAPAPVAQAPSGCSDCGTVYVGLTDADGDFLSYAVDVQSLTLRRADGAVVEALPVKPRVDFAQYVDLTEFLTAATVPTGTYVEGVLRLDYRNAEVTVESAGTPVPATLVSPDGTQLGVVDVRVVLDARHRLVVAPGRPALLTLDFDLSATHEVDLSTTPATVTARPALVASLEPVDEKELRLRGPLVSVDVAGGSYRADLRPFHLQGGAFGEVTVRTTPDTLFEVNGTQYAGGAGLEALAAAGPGTPTIAHGTLATAERRFTAERVHAGSSVPGQGIDAVLGSVLARSGDTLTVRGATVLRRDGEPRFVRGTLEVQVGPRTRVVRDGQGPVVPLDAAAISVGQRIAAFGELRQAGEGFELDATEGRVRLHLTHVGGRVVTSGPGEVTLGLAVIDGRGIEAFDFAGTGASAAQDADPAAYEVATGTLGVAQLQPGKWVRVFGYVEPFGLAPPDFRARTVVDFAELRAQLAVGWGSEGTTAPFLEIGPAGLVVDLANPDLGLRHHLKIGPRVIDLTGQPAMPRIVPPAAGPVAYVIRQDGTSQGFGDFARFAEDLARRLDGSARMTGFGATGRYDGLASEFTARTAIAMLD